MRILAFDPASSRNLGTSLICFDEETQKILSVESNTIVIVKEQKNVPWHIFCAIDELISKTSPDVVVIEKTDLFGGIPFVRANTTKCMTSILCACGKHDLEAVEIAPASIKKVITGSGRADKNEVLSSVHRIVSESGLSCKFDSEHSCDATAIGLCWLVRQEMLSNKTEPLPEKPKKSKKVKGAKS